MGNSDIVDGGAGTDTLFAVVSTTSSSATLLRPTLASVETVQFEMTDGSSTGTTSTFNFDKSSGVKTVNLKANAFNTNADTFAVTSVTTATSLKITDDAGAATTRANNYTMTYDGVTGAADSASVEISSTVAATELGNITVAGVETLTVSSTGGAGADYKLVGDEATTVNLNASAKSGGAVDLAGAKIATLNINAADSVAVTDGGAASAKLRTVNIDSQTADKTVTLTSLTPTMTSTAQDLVSEAFTVNVNGAGKAVVTADNTQFGTQSDTNADSFVVAASANTGGVTVTLSSMTSAAPRVVSVTGGTGNDTVNIATGSIDKYDTIALGAGTADTLYAAATAVVNASGTDTDSTADTVSSIFYTDTTVTADLPVISGVEVAKVGFAARTSKDDLTVDAESAKFASILELASSTTASDLTTTALTVNNVAAGQAVKIGRLDISDSGSGLTIGVKDATSTAVAASLTITSDLLGDAADTASTANAQAEIVSITANNVTAINATLDSAATTVTEVEIVSIGGDAATSIVLNSTKDLIVGGVTTKSSTAATVDASGATGKTNITVGGGDLTIKGSATKAGTFVMGTSLNASDTIVGGAATTDSLTATITDLASATTGALKITGVETISLHGATTASTINAAGITGATKIALSGSVNQTISNMAAGTGIALSGSASGSAAQFTGSLTVSLADATGSADSLDVTLTGTGTGNSTLVATGIETLNLKGVDNAWTAGTLNIAGVAASTIKVTGTDASSPAALNFRGGASTALNAATSTVDASAFDGAVVVDAYAQTATANATATSFKAKTAAVIFQGAEGADSFTIGTAENYVATTVGYDLGGGGIATDGSESINGKAGIDTLTVYADGSASLAAIQNVEIINVIAKGAADKTITIGGSGTGVNDASTLNVSGGTTDKVVTLSGSITPVSTGFTLDASNLAGSAIATFAADKFVTTVSAPLVIKGGASSKDVINASFDTANVTATNAVTMSGVEKLVVGALAGSGTAALTLNMANMTGLTTLNLDDAGGTGVAITTSGQAAGVVVALGNATNNFNSNYTAGLASSSGTADALTVELNNASSSTITASNIETLTLTATAAASSSATQSVTVAGTNANAATLVVTGSDADDEITLSGIAAAFTTITATGLKGDLSIAASARENTALTITGGQGNDSIAMENTADVLDGHSVAAGDNDTLVVDFTGTGGALIVDLSSSTDQVQMFNGLVNAAVQKNFESVNAAAYTQTNSIGADITGTTGANTVTGSAYADTIRTGAGADTIIVATAGAGNSDFIDGGADSDTLQLAVGSNTFATNENLVNVEAITLGNGTNTLTLTGQTEAFTITGGTGADAITAGGGADTITGGAGNDDFIFVAAANNGADVITDFTTNATALNSDGDDLNLKALITGTLTADIDSGSNDDGDLDTIVLDTSDTNPAGYTALNDMVVKVTKTGGTLAATDIVINTSAANGKLEIANDGEFIALVAVADTSTSFNVYYVKDTNAAATVTASVTLVGTVTMTDSETFADLAIADLILV